MSRKYAQLVELLETQGVLQFDGEWAEPIVEFVKNNPAGKRGADQHDRDSAELRKLCAERDTLRTANQRLEGEYSKLLESHVLDAETIHRLEGEVARLREALELWLADYDEVAANPNFEPFPHVAERVAKTRAALRGNGGE